MDQFKMGYLKLDGESRDIPYRPGPEPHLV